MANRKIEHKRWKMIFRKYGQPTIFIILTALIGTIFNQLLNVYQNSTKFLDYSTSSIKGILRPNYLIREYTREVKVLVDGKEIPDLSECTVVVANLGDVDLSDVPIYIELYPQDTNKLKVISTNVFDFNNSKESLSELKALTPTMKHGIRLGYIVHTFNRVVDYSTCNFTLKVLLDGDVEPKVIVQSDKVNVRVRKYSVKERNKFIAKHGHLIGFIVGAIIMTFVFPIGEYVDSRLKERKERKGLNEDKAD